MANTLLTSQLILNKTLELFHSYCPLVHSVDTRYSSEFKAHPGIGKGGASIQVRLPVMFTVSESNVLDVQDVVEQSVTVTVNKRAVIGFEFSDAELRMSIDEFADRYLKSAAARLAAQVESEGLKTVYQSVAQYEGTPGTTPATSTPWLNAGAILDNQCCPRDGERYALINPEASAKMVGAMQGLVNPSKDISKQYEEGLYSDAHGLKFRMDPYIRSHTCGTRTNTTPLVNEPTGANLVEGTTQLNIDGLADANATFKAGDIFTIAGVYDVNPETKDTLPYLKRFVVTEDVTATSNNALVKISPAIYTSASGALQNVSAMPVDNAAITNVGAASTTYPQNLVFHRNAIALVTIDEDIPNGVDMAVRDVADGISMRLVRDFNIINNKRICRYDVVYGWKVLRPEHIVRVWG